MKIPETSAAKLWSLLQILMAATVLLGTMWAVAIRPAMRDIVEERVREAQMQNENARIQIEQRTTAQLSEIKTTLQSIDKRLYELAKAK